MERWTGEQVDRWTGGQVVRWTGGQVVRWTGGYMNQLAGVSVICPVGTGSRCGACPGDLPNHPANLLPAAIVAESKALPT